MKAGVRRHGDIVPNIKVPRVRTDKGWKTHHPLSGQVSSFIERSGNGQDS